MHGASPPQSADPANSHHDTDTEVALLVPIAGTNLGCFAIVRCTVAAFLSRLSALYNILL